MVIRSPHISRNALAVLAILAALLVLVRPICEMWHAHAGTAAEVHAAWISDEVTLDDARTPASLCCPYVGDMGASRTTQAAWTGGSIDWQPMAPASTVLVAVAAVFIVRHLRWLRPPPGTAQSFYLRSARIRR